MSNKVLILGLGLSGRAAAQFLMRRGVRVCGVDKNLDTITNNEEVEQLRQAGAQIHHESDPLDIREFSQVVVSPGVPPTNLLYADAVRAGKEIIGEVELACRYMQHPCVAITGSNGKTTTTLLVEHVFNHAGRPAKALGNVGVPLTAALDDPQMGKDDIIVLELSSWQLETLRTPILDAGAILNITPNHLDRHLTMENYATAKFRMKNLLKPGRPFFVGHPCFQKFGAMAESAKTFTFGYEENCHIRCDETQVFIDETIAFILPQEYRGRVSHDVENMMAAFALCHSRGVTGAEFLSALSTFKKPPHRIQFVTKIKGVSYYDDSKGTSLVAVEKAVLAMSGPTWLIAGGLHKGAAYTPWLTAFAGKVRCVCAIGQAAQQMKQDLGSAIPVEIFATLEEAVSYASTHAIKGENVLLSPGCASYDMFKDYKHRGDEFQRLVNSIVNIDHF